MTKKNNIIARISLIILGIAISIGIGIGIAKAQPALPKDQSLQQRSLHLNELQAAKELKSLKHQALQQHSLSLNDLKAAHELKTLNAGLLQQHLLGSLTNKNLLAANAYKSTLRLELKGQLQNVVALKSLHGKLDLLKLNA